MHYQYSTVSLIRGRRKYHKIPIRIASIPKHLISSSSFNLSHSFNLNYATEICYLYISAFWQSPSLVQINLSAPNCRKILRIKFLRHEWFTPRKQRTCSHLDNFISSHDDKMKMFRVFGKFHLLSSSRLNYFNVQHSICSQAEIVQSFHSQIDILLNQMFLLTNLVKGQTFRAAFRTNIVLVNWLLWQSTIQEWGMWKRNIDFNSTPWFRLVCEFTQERHFFFLSFSL